MTFTHGPGRSLAICGPRIAILVDLAPSDPEIAQLLTVVADPANTLDEALEVLVQRGLRAVHDFALAEVTDDGSRIVVRGRFTARFGDGEPLIAQGLWTDRLGSPGIMRISAKVNRVTPKKVGISSPKRRAIKDSI